MNFISKNEVIWRYLLIIPMFVSSYISAITFVQLGLPLLGTEVLGISSNVTSNIILLFAFAGSCGALLGGFILQKIVSKLEWKIGIGIIMSMISLGMVALIPLLNSTADFLIWMVSLGFILSINTPISYSLLFDLVPHGIRGRVGGFIVALIYGIAPFLVPSEKTFENYAKSSPIVSVLKFTGTIMLIFFLVFRPVSKEIIKKNHGSTPHYHYSFKEILITLTAILFIDSFGFIRAINTPFVDNTWEGPLNIRIFISISHIISALVCGYLYDKKSPKIIVKISLVCFVIGNLLFTFMYSTVAEPILYYLFPLFYAPAVSIYTILFLMIWADISTEENEGKVYGIAQSITGWLASFISTSFALSLNGVISPQLHLAIAAILALIALIYELIRKH
ncbi:MFS transporter [Candidatus Harpocratesius sp.]